jgi:hypothetical protein
MVLISRYSLKPCSPLRRPSPLCWCRRTGDAEECAAVDGDAAGAHALGDPQCPFGVGATDFTGKPVNRVVGDRDGLVVGVLRRSSGHRLCAVTAVDTRPPRRCRAHVFDVKAQVNGISVTAAVGKVDDLHFIDFRHRNSIDVSNHLKGWIVTMRCQHAGTPLDGDRFR